MHHVLNECLIDRGSSPSMVSMECFIDGHHLTNIIVCPPCAGLVLQRAALVRASPAHKVPG